MAIGIERKISTDRGYLPSPTRTDERVVVGIRPDVYYCDPAVQSCPDPANDGRKTQNTARNLFADKKGKKKKKPGVSPTPPPPPPTPPEVTAFVDNTGVEKYYDNKGQICRYPVSPESHVVLAQNEKASCNSEMQSCPSPTGDVPVGEKPPVQIEEEPKALLADVAKVNKDKEPVPVLETQKEGPPVNLADNGVPDVPEVTAVKMPVINLTQPANVPAPEPAGIRQVPVLALPLVSQTIVAGQTSFAAVVLHTMSISEAQGFVPAIMGAVSFIVPSAQSSQATVQTRGVNLGDEGRGHGSSVELPLPGGTPKSGSMALSSPTICSHIRIPTPAGADPIPAPMRFPNFISVSTGGGVPPEASPIAVAIATAQSGIIFSPPYIPIGSSLGSGTQIAFLREPNRDKVLPAGQRGDSGDEQHRGGGSHKERDRNNEEEEQGLPFHTHMG